MIPQLGLTGNIACGKSTVARLLAARGAAVIDADALVHELYSDPEFAARVAALFEEQIRSCDGTINRAALGRIVFADARALKRLESVAHPAVAALREEKVREFEAMTPPPPAIVFEAVKLLEAGQGEACAAVWCVVCAADIQLRRLMETRGLSEDAARARLTHQPSLEAKKALLGDGLLILIENNGTLNDLEAQVEAKWQAFLRRDEGERG